MSVLILNWIYDTDYLTYARFLPFWWRNFYTPMSRRCIFVTLSNFPVREYFSYIDAVSTYKSIVSITLNRKFDFLFPLRFLAFCRYIYISNLEITFSRLCVCVQFQCSHFAQDKFKIRTVDCFKTYTALMHHLENGSHCRYYTIF